MSLLILDQTKKIWFPLHSEIAVYHAPLNFGISPNENTIKRKLSFFYHLKLLNQKFNEISPNIVITTEYSFTIAARIVLKRAIKLFSWEHHHFYHLKKSRFWETLFRKFYPKINKVVCLNSEEAKTFELIGCKTCVIPNFLWYSSQIQASLEQKRLLTIGWFSKTKGIDMIPSIAKKISQKYPDWKWKVIGDGEQKNNLKKYDGFIETSEPILKIEEEYMKSSIYVLPSRFECFPMVLLEAMGAGLPCIAFNCPTGPRHIIQNSEDGLLIEQENIDAMANAIIDLIEHPEKRKKFGNRAFKNVQRFSPEIIYQKWEELFNEI